jgi:hypothetical protein
MSKRLVSIRARARRATAIITRALNNTTAPRGATQPALGQRIDQAIEPVVVVHEEVQECQ